MCHPSDYQEVQYKYFFNYTIFSNTLECVDDHEYVGVSISHNLCWEKHCNKIAKKANETFLQLCRTLSPCSKQLKSRVYQSLVRPQHEYTAAAWNPYYITIADRLEHTQCAAARFVHNDYRRTTSVKISSTFLAGIVSTLGDWFLNSPCFTKYTTT